MLIQGVTNVPANTITSNQLTTTGVTPGTYGSASQIPTVTVDQSGRVTGIANTGVSIPSGAYLDPNDVIFTNNLKLNSSVVIPPNTGAFSVGPVTQAVGTTLTISANARYVIF